MQPKEFEPRKLILPGLLVVGLIALTYWRSAHALNNYHLQGETMGTSYNIKLANSSLSEAGSRAMREEIEALLEEINRQMSTWRPDSEISTFNSLPAGKKIRISDHFIRVLEVAGEVAATTGKAFHPCVLPLVELWGFGQPGSGALPEAEAIRNALAQVDGVVDRLRIQGEEGLWLSKNRDGLKMDLSAIAKGYAVDAIVEHLSKHRVDHFFVEIGGELRARGLNPDQQPWRIGIPVPEPDNFSERYMDLLISGQSVATSGDYRNFRLTDDGKRLSHIIDPRNGYPVEHMLASVTVIASTCARADGLATGLYVMGQKAGLKLVNQLDGVEALFISRDGDRFQHTQSSGWGPYIAK